MKNKLKQSSRDIMVGLQLLDEIAAKFYGIRSQSALEGLFGDMFRVRFTSFIYHSFMLIASTLH